MPKTKRSHDSITKSTSRKRTKVSSGTTASLDDLNWRPVSMPDRLDDVEGFFGLEEVDGIDVIQTDGKIQYKLLDQPTKKKGNPTTRDGAREWEEWDGFSDSGEQDEGSTPGPLKRSEKMRKKEKQPKKKKKQSPSDSTDAASPDVNPFESLQDEEEDVDLPAWAPLNLSLPTLRALEKLSFTSPTPIQSAAIPDILAGHDVIGKASTGSGKTLAFGIPILEAYLASNTLPHELEDAQKTRKKDKCPIGLVLAPTRELAHQLHDHLKALAAFAPDFRIVTLTGGMSLQKQTRQLESNDGVDLIIATPGRLWEVLSDGHGWIDKLRKGLKFLVIDEADRLLQEGHFKEAEEVLSLLNKDQDDESSQEMSDNGEEDVEDEEVFEYKQKPARRANNKPTSNRQTLVFSATFHRGLQQKLAGKGKKDWSSGVGGELMDEKESMSYLLKKLKFWDNTPKFVDVNPVGQMAERLREGIIECGAMEKDLYLYYLLLRYPCRTLVFTNSISSVKRLAPFLSELELPAHPLHSSMIQKARLRNLERFSSPSNPNAVLVATDVAARGLDISAVEMVIHYHLPRTADMYVHRSGRTARADARGISVLLCAPEEVAGVRRLVGKVHEGQSDRNTGHYMMKSFNVDRKLVTRLKRRVELSKRIADSTVEKQKQSKEDDWLKTAAEELGVDYDSDEFNARQVGKKGVRGKQKREKAANATKGDIASWKAELRALLKQKINSGFSERYLTSGNVNIAQALLDGDTMHSSFLGIEKKRIVDEVSW